MKEISYGDHLKLRLKLREIPEELPLDIYQTAIEKYYDNLTDLSVAIKSVEYKGRVRDLAVSYKETSTEVILITIHPLKFQQKENRIKSRRWERV